MNIVENSWRFFLNILFPLVCPGCKKNLESKEEAILVCENCLKTVQVNNSFFCSHCERRLGMPQKNCHKEKGFVLASATYYSGVMQGVIHALKYQGNKNLKNVIAKILEKYWKKIYGEMNLKEAIIVPMPLHPQKERLRGYNQSILISEELSKISNLPIDRVLLIKIKNTPSQTNLDFKKRLENVKDSFLAKNPENIKGKKIILIDDVFTSGATMKEAIKTLKKAGAKKVIGFVLAKTSTIL